MAGVVCGILARSAVRESALPSECARKAARAQSCRLLSSAPADRAMDGPAESGPEPRTRAAGVRGRRPTERRPARRSDLFFATDGKKQEAKRAGPATEGRSRHGCRTAAATMAAGLLARAVCRPCCWPMDGPATRSGCWPGRPAAAIRLRNTVRCQDGRGPQIM